MKTIAQQMRQRTEAAMETAWEDASGIHNDLLNEIEEAANGGADSFIWEQGRRFWYGTKREKEIWSIVQDMLIADGFETNSERSGGALRIYW